MSMAVSEGLVCGPRHRLQPTARSANSVFPAAIGSGTLLSALVVAGACSFLLVAVVYTCLRRGHSPAISTALTFLVVCTIGNGPIRRDDRDRLRARRLALTVPEERARGRPGRSPSAAAPWRPWGC